MKNCRFGNTPKDNDDLAELVQQGIKTASCSAYFPDNDLPHVGDLFMVENSVGQALCTIKITEISILRFSDIDSRFAFDEGEGDRSLEYWRKEHESFFRAEGTFSHDMLLVCERFRVV